MAKRKNNQKKVTRYTHEDVKEPRTPETGHTKLLPSDEQVVTLPMDNGWSKAIQVGKLPEDDKPVVLDMDPAADPVLFWAGKRNKREIPILPLQRNEIISESRIAQIIERAKKAAAEKSGEPQQRSFFAELEKTLRESEKGKRVEFYTHDEGWKNKLICGDSLHVMESLLHYEGLREKVQMIYIDPPYGIKYDSNFQQRVDSTKNDEKDQADDVLTIRAFRDTWALGVHSWLEYLKERLYLCRELLATSGSVFIQISDENLHRARLLCDEVLGAKNYIRVITFRKKSMPLGGAFLEEMNDYILWYAKDKDHCLYRQLYRTQDVEGLYYWNLVELPDGTRRRLTPQEQGNHALLPQGASVARLVSMSPPTFSENAVFPFDLDGVTYRPPEGGCWITGSEGMRRLAAARRLVPSGKSLMYFYKLNDFPYAKQTALWLDTGTGNFTEPKLYAVQTSYKVVERCIQMTTNPGDLVFDPTCGSGVTAYCAEKIGRRWITCDTSRVAINVARQRLLGATFEHYMTRNGKVSGNFVYKTANRATLKSIANDLEPEKVELVDQPEVNKDAIRVCGPFEVMSLGRYSVEDWKGYVKESGQLYNYIDVICKLYRKDAAVQGSSGLVHAIAESGKEKIAISVGPLSGRVTGKQINDAVQDALASGLLEVHVLGWAFEANVGEIKSQLESRGKVKVELIMIRPDTLAEGLKVTDPSMLFSPLALPDIEVKLKKNGKEGPEAAVTLNGVAVFDRAKRTTEYKHADSGYVSAWYLDEDYDGDCFVDCQMFFDFKKAPNLKAALKAEIEPEEFKLQLTSRSFKVRSYKRIAVKVVDVFGNESTVVKDIG